MKTSTHSTLWTVIATASGIAAGMATRNAMETSFHKTTSRRPPQKPIHDSTSWREALLWAAAVGACTGVARLLGKEGARRGQHAVKRLT